jgi:hypothetical protein
MTAEQSTPQPPIELPAAAVLRVLEESHPEAVRYAMWRVRGEMAEARAASAEAELAALRAEKATD